MTRLVIFDLDGTLIDSKERHWSVFKDSIIKIKKSEIEPNLKPIRADLSLPDNCIIIPFSAEKGNGREELVRQVLNAVKEYDN